MPVNNTSLRVRVNERMCRWQISLLMLVPGMLEQYLGRGERGRRLCYRSLLFDNAIHLQRRCSSRRLAGLQNLEAWSVPDSAVWVF